MLFWLLLQAAIISGKVTSAQTGAPIARVQIWAEPEGRSSDPKRFSDATGTFRIPAVIPGDYFVLPWPLDQEGPLLDPEIFPQAQKYAVSVTIERSGTITQDLKVTPQLRAFAQTFVQ